MAYRPEIAYQDRMRRTLRHGPRWKPHAPKPPPEPCRYAAGDQVYVAGMPNGDQTLMVKSVGVDGIQAEDGFGGRHRIRHSRILGLRQKHEPSFELLDEGEDGAVCRDVVTGEIRFVPHGQWERNPA